MDLVTGAAGHLGNLLVRELLGRGRRVRAMVLPGEPLRSLEGLDLELVEADVLDVSSLERAMRGIDVVYHLAGVISITRGDERRMWQVNVDGARNVARVALRSGVRRMVHVSSIHALAYRPGGAVDERAPLALDASPHSYDRTKAEGVRAVLEVVRGGLDAVIACPTGIIGPHDYLGSLMGRVIRGFTSKRVHFIVDGAFDFVDGRDVARGLILLAERGRTGEAYILSGTRVRLRELAHLVGEMSGRRACCIVVPRGLALVAATVWETVARLARVKVEFTRYAVRTLTEGCTFSSAKARDEVGYTSRPLQETLADTVRWWRDISHRMSVAGVRGCVLSA